MDRARLKNYILLILLLVNLLLLGLLASRYRQEQAARERTAAELSKLFASESISLETDIPAALPPAGMTLSRDLEEERTLAAALLGDGLNVSDEGGGIHVFSNDAGQVLFRSGGSFEAEGLLAERDAEAVCRKFCQAFGYQAFALTLENGGGTGTAVQYLGGYPVANASVEFTVSGGSLVAVSGTYLSQKDAAAVSGGSMTAVTALSKFLNARRSGGAVVSSVTGISLCYEVQSTAAPVMSLIPAWCVATDTGEYYVNCVTGAVTQG